MVAATGRVVLFCAGVGGLTLACLFLCRITALMGSVVEVHGSTFLDARSRLKPRFAAIPEGHGKTGTSALNHRQKETPRQEQGEKSANDFCVQLSFL